MASSGSAFWGNPPANDYDKSILIGISGSKTGKYKIPPKLPLAPGSPVSQSVPPVVGMSFALALVVVITGGRLAARTFYRGQKFGLDDIMIIPAVVSPSTMISPALRCRRCEHGINGHFSFLSYLISLSTCPPSLLPVPASISTMSPTQNFSYSASSVRQAKSSFSRASTWSRFP